MKTKLKNTWIRLAFATGALFAGGQAMALGRGESDFTPPGTGDIDAQEGLDGLEQFLTWLIAGPGGNIIVMLGIIVALIMVVASASLRPIMFVLGLAILVGWGPGLFLWIVSAGATPDAILAWAAAR